MQLLKIKRGIIFKYIICGHSRKTEGFERTKLALADLQISVLHIKFFQAFGCFIWRHLNKRENKQSPCPKDKHTICKTEKSNSHCKIIKSELSTSLLTVRTASIFSMMLASSSGGSWKRKQAGVIPVCMCVCVCSTQM